VRKEKMSQKQDVKNTGEKQPTKEQIAALKQEKKKAQEELDELQGKTTGGKIVCFLAFLGILAVFGGAFIGLVKLNVGNFASDVLAPVIGSVAIVRSILPSEYQSKTTAEIAADEQAAADAAAAQVASEQANAQAEADAAAEEQAIADQQAAADAQAEEALAEEQAAEEEAAAEQALADQQAADEAALADYVDTYSKMKPKTAAKVFDNMMTDQSDLVVKILTNMTPDNRAAIISNMSVANASQLTVLMEQ